MKTITYARRDHEVEIVALLLPREPGLMGGQNPRVGEEPNVTLICPIELHLGTFFELNTGGHHPTRVRVLGCAPRADGRFVVLGVLQPAC